MYANDALVKSLEGQDDVTLLIQNILDSMLGPTVAAVSVYWPFAQQFFIAHDPALPQNLRDAVVTAAMRGEAASKDQQPLMVPVKALIAFGARRGTISFLLNGALDAGEGDFIYQQQFLAAALAWGESLFSQKHHKQEAINSLLSLVDLLDSSLITHSKNVANYALLLAEAMECSKQQIEAVYYAAMFHELGRLYKQEGISAELPLRGAAFVQQFTDLYPIALSVKHHEEFFGGGGFPLGLSGEHIPLEARIIGVADRYDKLMAEHFSKSISSKKQVALLLRQYAPTQLDPILVDTFICLAEKW